MTKIEKAQFTDTKFISYLSSGGSLLQNWKTKSNDKNKNSKIQNLIKSTKTNSLTGQSETTSLPPISDSFMCKETSSGNNGNGVFISFEQTDIFQISTIQFYYNRFSILENTSMKSMGRLKIQLLIIDNTWSTRYSIPKNDPYSNSATQWMKLSLILTVENSGFRLLFNKIDSAHSDMCFSIIILADSVG